MRCRSRRFQALRLLDGSPSLAGEPLVLRILGAYPRARAGILARARLASRQARLPSLSGAVRKAIPRKPIPEAMPGAALFQEQEAP
jgi:hypothetical protein